MKSRLSQNHWLFTRPSAHRGLWDEQIPENSISAYLAAAAANYPIELDVQMTSDDKLVCFHDDDMERMTKLSADIRKTDFSTVRSQKLKDTDERIPTFSEMLSAVGGKVPLLIEIKSQLRDGIVPKILDELKNYEGEFVIQSFDPRIMQKVKKLAPEIIRGQLGTAEKSGKGKLTDFVIKHLPLNFSVKPDFINYNVKNLPIGRLTSNNLPTICWTIRTEEQKNIAEKYAKGFVFEHIRP